MSSQDAYDKLDTLHFFSKMDTVYPEHLSRHHKIFGANLIESNAQNYKRKVKKNLDRRGRFRTQPITFTEIKEVDEESAEQSMKNVSASHGVPTVNVIEDLQQDNLPSPGLISKSRSEVDLKKQPIGEDFYRISFRRGSPGTIRKKSISPTGSGPILTESPSEEVESEDQVFQLMAPICHQLPQPLRPTPQIESPQMLGHKLKAFPT